MGWSLKHEVCEITVPAYTIRYGHSGMPEGFVGTLSKHANSEKDALDLLGSKLYKGDNTRILDKRRSILTIISINEEA